MGFRKDAYAKIWKVEKQERYTRVNLSVSKKNRDTGEYETEFSGFVNLVGDAHKKAINLEENDRIKILSCDVTTRYDKASNRTFTNYTIFDWENAGTTAGEPKPTPTKQAEVNDDAEDDLPF